jgi:hypothetical protein
VAFYVLGIPFAFVAVLVFHWGTNGTWLGLSLGQFCIGTGYIFVIIKTNWKHISELAQQNAGVEFRPLDLKEVEDVPNQLEMIEDAVGT